MCRHAHTVRVIRAGMAMNFSSSNTAAGGCVTPTTAITATTASFGKKVGDAPLTTVWISPLMAQELRRIVEESGIIKCVAATNRQRRRRTLAQKERRRPPRARGSPWKGTYLVRGAHTHLTQTSKIGSLVEVQESDDPEGLRVMYYLVQDLKVGWASRSSHQCLVFSLISLNFKIKPISV